MRITSICSNVAASRASLPYKWLAMRLALRLCKVTPPRWCSPTRNMLLSRPNLLMLILRKELIQRNHRRLLIINKLENA